MSSNYTLVLGSNSPRRKELLASTGLPFEILPIGVDENYPDELAKKLVPEYIAKAKANSVDIDLANKLLITADTMVFMQDKIIGKPESMDHAIEILNELSGEKHTVITGLCISGEDKQICFSVSTEVKFRSLSDAEIGYYVSKYEPLDKAGAYGIQEWIGLIGVEEINGSYHNVMGLPVSQLISSLNIEFGFTTFD